MWNRLRRWVRDLPIHDPIERRQALLVQVILLGLSGVLLFAALLTLVAYPFTTGAVAAANLGSSISNFRLLLFVMVPFVLLRRGAFRAAVAILMLELFLLGFTTIYVQGLEAGWIGVLEFALPISLAALALGRRWLLLISAASIGGVAATAFARYPLSGLPQNAPSATIAFALIAGLLALFLDRFGTTFRESLAALRTAHAELEQRVNERTLQLANANHALEQASLAKDRFFANMSHELRTPLNAIIGFTGTLLMRLPGPLTPDQEKQLHTVRQSAEHLLALINDVLDLAKVESGTLEMPQELVECQAVIAEVVASLHPLAAQKGLQLLVDAPAEPLVIKANHRALSQILINLVNNAIKFTERGHVKIILDQLQDGRAAIHVTDSGIGIRLEDQEQLFQLFTQIKGAQTRQHEGTGLGLNLSQKLAGLLGGQITVQSAPGQGSTFTLTLPLA
jgi:signal transduction histidine kinase